MPNCWQGDAPPPKQLRQHEPAAECGWEDAGLEDAGLEEAAADAAAGPAAAVGATVAAAAGGSLLLSDDGEADAGDDSEEEGGSSEEEEGSSGEEGEGGHEAPPALEALDVDGLWCLLGEAASSAQRALRSGLLDDAEAAALHAGLQGVRGLISRPWTLEDKQRQLAALCAAQDQLVAGCMGGVKTAGQPPDLFNLPFVLAWLVQQKSYPPRWSAKQVAAAGQPAAEGGLCNLAAGAAKPPLAQSVQQMNQLLHAVLIRDPAAGCDAGGGSGRTDGGHPRLLAPLTDLQPHNDCSLGYSARCRYSDDRKYITNTTPSMAGLQQHYAQQLRELYLDSAAAAKVAVLVGEGADFGRLLGEAVAKGSWPGVPGTLLDISEPLTNAVLQQLCSGSGYGRLVAALEAEPGRCGGLSGPFGVLWRRPGGLLPLIILSSAHGCSEQWHGKLTPAGTVHVVAALAALCGQPMPPYSQLPSACVGMTGDELRWRSDERYGCRPCQLALNVMLYARGEPLLPKGGHCSGACVAAGLAQLPKSRQKRMYEMINNGLFCQPSRLLRLSKSAATCDWVDAAHAARQEASAAAEAAVDDDWDAFPPEQLPMAEVAEIHGWGSPWVQLADPAAAQAAWERQQVKEAAQAAALAERERRQQERAVARLWEAAAAKAAKAAQRERARERERERIAAQVAEESRRAAERDRVWQRQQQERAVARLWEAAAAKAAKAAQRERERERERERIAAQVAEESRRAAERDRVRQRQQQERAAADTVPRHVANTIQQGMKAFWGL